MAQIAATAPAPRRKVFLQALALAFCLRLVEWSLLGAPVAVQLSPPETSGRATANTSRPRGLRLVMIGDSLTRYTYLSLVYFLKWGSWYEPQRTTPHLVQSSSFDNLWHNQTWGEHSWQTNRMLYPLELCDCYRKLPGRLQVNKVVNNRYFYDPELDNFVVYLDAKGHKGSLHGRIAASNVSSLLKQQFTLQQSGQLLSPPFDYLKRPFAWVYTSWSEAIDEYVNHLSPRPTHVVLNAGLWPNNFLYQPNLVDDIIKALSPATKGIWKTTSYGKGGTVLYPSIPETDQTMCSKLNDCWNLSWTKRVADRWYWDDKHFYEPAYRVMNEDFLHQMGVLPPNYQPLDRSILFQ